MQTIAINKICNLFGKFAFKRYFRIKITNNMDRTKRNYKVNYQFIPKESRVFYRGLRNDSVGWLENIQRFLEGSEACKPSTILDSLIKTSDAYYVWIGIGMYFGEIDSNTYPFQIASELLKYTMEFAVLANCPLYHVQSQQVIHSQRYKGCRVFYCQEGFANPEQYTTSELTFNQIIS